MRVSIALSLSIMLAVAPDAVSAQVRCNPADTELLAGLRCLDRDAELEAASWQARDREMQAALEAIYANNAVAACENATDAERSNCVSDFVTGQRGYLVAVLFRYLGDEWEHYPLDEAEFRAWRARGLDLMQEERRENAVYELAALNQRETALRAIQGLMRRLPTECGGVLIQ